MGQTLLAGIEERRDEYDLLRRSFVLMLKAEGKASSTIRRYELSVREFQACARAMGFPPELTSEHVLHFLAWRREDRAPNTARNDQMALSRFFRFLVDEGELRTNPLERVPAPPVDVRIPDPYSSDELKAMFVAGRGKDVETLRDTAILWVLLDTGLRASEFCSLTVLDVEMDAERIKVRGKGRRERFVRIGIRAQRALDRYLRIRRQARPELWLNRTGEPLTTSGLFQIVRRVCRRAGVHAPGVHCFRHTAATMMCELGISDQDLMELMGWRSHAMAARYTRSGASERALRSHRVHSAATFSAAASSNARTASLYASSVMPMLE